MVLEIYDLVGDFTNAANVQVAWLSNLAERHLDCKKLKYNRYNDFLKTLDSSSRVREMIKQHHTAQDRKTRATKKLGDLGKHYPEPNEIQTDSRSRMQWMRLTVIANETSKDPVLPQRCLNLAYIKCLPKLDRKSKSNKWYTSGDFHEAKMLLDNGCLQLEEGINYKAIGLKWYRGLVMPLSYYPGMEDHNNANWLRTIPQSVPTADLGLSPATHWMSVPPPSPDRSKMLPPPSPSIKGNEKETDESNVGGLLKQLAENGSEDGTSTPSERDTGTVPTAPTEKDHGTIPAAPTEKDPYTVTPAPTKKEAGTTTPASTGKEAGTTRDKPTNPQYKCTPKPDWPTTPGSESSNSDDDDTDNREYVSCFLEWLVLDPAFRRRLDNQTQMLAHHERQMGNKAVPIIQKAVNDDPELFTEAQAQITTAVHAMHEVIVQFDTQLGKISYLATGQRKLKADREGGKRKQVRKE